MLNARFASLEAIHITGQQVKFFILTHLTLVLTLTVIAQYGKMYQR